MEFVHFLEFVGACISPNLVIFHPLCLYVLFSYHITTFSLFSSGILMVWRMLDLFIFVSQVPEALFLFKKVFFLSFKLRNFCFLYLKVYWDFSLSSLFYCWVLPVNFPSRLLYISVITFSFVFSLYIFSLLTLNILTFVSRVFVIAHLSIFVTAALKSVGLLQHLCLLIIGIWYCIFPYDLRFSQFFVLILCCFVGIFEQDVLRPWVIFKSFEEYWYFCFSGRLTWLGLIYTFLPPTTGCGSNVSSVFKFFSV